MRIIKVALAAFSLMAGLCSIAVAQTWPGKPITMVLPFPAGGSAEVVGRAMADEMGKRLGQPVVVENRAGASGIVGASYVAKAPADGYTMMFTTTLPIMTNQFVYAKLPYDPRKDFALISQVATGRLVMAVHPSVQAKSVKEFVAWAQQNKGKVNYGSWGVGSAAHLMGAFLSNSRGMDMSHIAYKGEAPMLQDLIGGQVQIAIGSYMSIKPYLESGKLRALAVTGEKRIGTIADVPTFEQAGLREPEFRPVGWLVLVAPAATPAPVLARLEKEAIAAANTTAVKARLQVAGLEAMGTTSARFREDYQSAMPVLERVVKASGARVE
jgi:tripartite-type tricarboxylate transporter receptor subunit TctC